MIPFNITKAGGRISMTWQIDSTATPPRLRMSWVETGVTIAALAPRRRGFGQELIERTLPYELSAITTFTLTPGGMHCDIDLPLTSRAGDTGRTLTAECRAGLGAPTTPQPTACGAAYLMLLLSAERLCRVQTLQARARPYQAVLRGGGWNNNALNVRAPNRNRNAPANRNNNIGFGARRLRARR